MELSDDDRLCRHVFPGMYLHRKDTATGAYNKSDRGFTKVMAEQDCSLVKDQAIWKLVVEEVILDNWIRQKKTKEK